MRFVDAFCLFLNYLNTGMAQSLFHHHLMLTSCREPVATFTRVDLIYLDALSWAFLSLLEKSFFVVNCCSKFRLEPLIVVEIKEFVHFGQ